MNKPCPLYFKPADILAALSIETDGPVDFEPTARRLRPRLAFWRAGAPWSSAVERSRWRLPGRAGRSGRSAEATDAATPRLRPGEARPPAAGTAPPAGAGRVLLSHFELVQSGS